MVKDIIVVADLGAGANLIKNLLLLGDTHWPLSSDRFKTILNQYSPDKSLDAWIPQEYVLRFWTKWYGVDISNTLDQEKFTNRVRHDLSVVYINHSAFYEDNFDWFSDQCKIVYVRPSSTLALEWQIRAYHEKKAYKNMHDFSFVDKTKKIEYLKNHSEGQYTKINIENMKEIMSTRQKEFHKHRIDIIIELEDLIFNNYQLISRILDIDPLQCMTTMSSWIKLHWPIQNTYDWDHHDCFY